MKLAFSGDVTGLEQGIRQLAPMFGYEQDNLDGFPIQLVMHERDEIVVSRKPTEAVISFKQKIHFYRALGLLLEDFAAMDEFSVIESPQFEKNGLFFDVSQGNAVTRPDRFQEVLSRMAIMGLNVLYIYMEDSYILHNEPYFGYMRGKYSYDDLKSIDDFAYALDIEVVPCIQTLAHMQDVLKWSRFQPIREDAECLLPGEPQTYEFIENEIATIMSPFRTNRLHIGYDEAWGLGLGEYLKRNGFHEKVDIMTKHLNKIVEIMRKRHIVPVAFSDMYFRTPRLAGYGNNYDPEIEIPQHIVDSLPNELQMVFWEYNQDQPSFYKSVIDKHNDICAKTIFGGGIWNWLGFGVNYGITFRTTNAALEACKSKGITEVYASHWGDDGTENNLFSAMLGWQLFAEHGYARELDEEKLRKRFAFCTGGNYDDFMDIKYLDEVPGTKEDNMGMSNPSKYLLWQNIMAGLYDKHIEGLQLNEHYTKVAKRMRECIGRNGKYDFVFQLLEKVSSVLSIKAEIGLQLTEAYKGRNQEALRRMLNEILPELKHRAQALRQFHMELWFKTNKALGWDILDIRYGGLLMNIDTTTQRLQHFLHGDIDRIEELEEERLYIDEKPGMPAIYTYSKMPSGSRLFQ